ncbi:MAG: LapA family protein [Halioglobus sp.]|nr:LapA family protein [Halioglobus sp.]
MKQLRKLLTVIVILAMLVLSMLFAAQNEVSVPLNVLVYTFSPQSLAVWVLVAFALGGVVGMIVSSVILVRTRASLSACRKQLDRAREDVSKLRGTVAVAEAA